MSRTDDSTSNKPESPSDYEVGYGKPPRRTRFKPGRSGNPRGRPKGTKNLKTDLSEELAEKILVREGETSRSVSKQRALVKTLMSKSLKGEPRSASLLTTWQVQNATGHVRVAVEHRVRCRGMAYA